MTGIGLVCPAAGRGARMGAGEAKQLRPLGGRPVLVATLERFAGLVDEAVVVVPSGEVDRYRILLDEAGPGLRYRVVAGGSNRFRSVLAGLEATDPAFERVLVHDAVRPLVPRRCIRDCIAALADHDAAVVAEPCAATVKRDDGHGRVAETLDRTGLWLAQTPQGMRLGVGLQAYRGLGDPDPPPTDEGRVCELAGLAVALVRGDPGNIKLTEPADFDVAAARLQAGLGD